MDSPSAYLVNLLEICTPPRLDGMYFVYIQGQPPLPSELELGLRCCCYCTIAIVHLKLREYLEARWCCAIACVDDYCHYFTEVTCICVQFLLIACRSIVKIDNKIITILIGKVLFNKFIDYHSTWMHV